MSFKLFLRSKDWLNLKFIEFFQWLNYLITTNLGIFLLILYRNYRLILFKMTQCSIILKVIILRSIIEFYFHLRKVLVSVSTIIRPYELDSVCCYYFFSIQILHKFWFLPQSIRWLVVVTILEGNGAFIGLDHPCMAFLFPWIVNVSLIQPKFGHLHSHLLKLFQSLPFWLKHILIQDFLKRLLSKFILWSCHQPSLCLWGIPSNNVGYALLRVLCRLPLLVIHWDLRQSCAFPLA